MFRAVRRTWIPLLAFLIVAQIAAAFCPLRESDGTSSADYGKAFVQFLDLSGQVFDRNASLAKQLQAEELRESYSTIMLALKFQNADWKCGLSLVEPFLNSKAHGIEASASSTRSWIVAMMVSNDLLVDEVKTALSNEGRQDLGRVLDKITDHTVRSGTLWDELPHLATLSTYAFVDLDGDPASKIDSLNITTAERKQLLSLLTQSFPGIQRPSKQGRFAPEASAWLLQTFLNKPFWNRADEKGAPAKK